VLAVVKLFIWHYVPDRSKVMTQTKRDTLVLQVWCYAWGSYSPRKLMFVEKLEKL